MSFDFTPSTDAKTVDLHQAVFQALGAASVCWDTPEAAGTFHSDRAREIGDALIAYINQNYYHRRTRVDVVVEAPLYDEDGGRRGD